MKTKEHMQWQDFRLVAWVALTHVALVLRYNLAFWLLWNGPLLPAELDFSVISAQRLEVCSHKSTCWRHCTYGPLRNKEISAHWLDCIIHILSGAFRWRADRLCPWTLFLAKRDFFFDSISSFSCSYLYTRQDSLVVWQQADVCCLESAALVTTVFTSITNNNGKSCLRFKYGYWRLTVLSHPFSLGLFNDCG